MDAIQQHVSPNILVVFAVLGAGLFAKAVLSYLRLLLSLFALGGKPVGNLQELINTGL
jgi:hypothetical protein